MRANLGTDIEAIKDDFFSCPFCGRQPVILPWHGGGPRKVLVQCPAEYTNECPADVSVCEESPEEALVSWNQRRPRVFDFTT